jgi:hypothetical protein
MRARRRFAWGLLACAVVAGRIAAAQNPDRRQLERIERGLQQEGEAVVAIADAAARGDGAPPADFSLSWRNDFLKAQGGTFVPFIVGIGVLESRAAAALLYVRVAPYAQDERPARPARRSPSVALEGSGYPFEEIYPVDLSTGGIVTSLARGFSISAGEYDVTVVVRERERRGDRGRRLAAVLRRRLSVPDYSKAELSTSTVILADRLTVLPGPLAPGEQFERPYVIGGRDIVPAADSVFRRSEELIVVFLVYNPSVTPDKHFDLEVEYHFFRKNRDGGGDPPGARGSTSGRPIPASQPGETYVNRTEPQRFNPAVLGPQFEPAAGQPVMAGQGVPLTGFREGEYRLAIRVTDLVSGRSIERHVSFSVQP